jgi:monofunctional biosynthetic peptidoglycan transglycosylase
MVNPKQVARPMIFPEIFTLSRRAACRTLVRDGRMVASLRPSRRDSPSAATGKNGYRLLARVVRILRLVPIAILAAHLMLATLVAGFCLVYAKVDPPVNALMLYRAVFYKWKIQMPKPITLGSVPRRVRNMLVWIEDGGFYENWGIELAALKRAYEINKSIDYPLYGGSTITMQLARTLFLYPDKSYFRKYLEVIIAIEMDVLLSKNRILELYINNVEWGKGVFGIQAASSYYYRRSVSSLSEDEQARLVTVLSSPIKYSPDDFERSKILSQRYALLAKKYL